ncbi:MAG TPA: hypothetical protein VFN27_01800 [Xanthobacteraceae bacterium]|nr:hypothetical protein [Xanthobacteraceae bacterium]
MTEIGSVKRENLNGNFSSTNPIFGEYGGINCDAEFKMEIDTEDDETNAKRFRDYAAECRRLARTASEKDRVVLIEIAEAWMVCAEQAERNARRNRRH